MFFAPGEEGRIGRPRRRGSKMSWSDALLSIALIDGLLAQRKLDGDTTIYAPDDPQVLQAIISQGKYAEGILRRNGGEEQIRDAYRTAGQEYHHQEQ